MTAITPRAAVLPASPASAPGTTAAGERPPAPGARDFETVLRGHSQRPAPTSAAVDRRERHGRPTSDDTTPASGTTAPTDDAATADSTATTDSAATAGPAGPDPSDAPAQAAGGPTSVTAAAAAGAGQVPSGPAASAPGMSAAVVAGVMPSGSVAATGPRPEPATAGAPAPAGLSGRSGLSGTEVPAGPPAPAGAASPAGLPTAAVAPSTAAGHDPRVGGSAPSGSPVVGGPAVAGAADDTGSGPTVPVGAPAGAPAGSGATSLADATAQRTTPGDPSTTVAADAPAGSPAYGLAPVGATPAGTGAPSVTAGDARPAQPALPPQAQVLNAVSPLLTTADGTHRLTVHLAPAHLGSVQVHLEVRGGEVTVRLTAVDPATGEALRHGTAELRSHLERTGLRSAAIDVQVAPGDPARDPGAGGSATADRGSRDQDQRDPSPRAGTDGTGRGGDTPPDGAWQHHGRPLEGWTPRAGGARPSGDAPAAPDQLDPPRPRPRDVRVDVRM